MIHSGRHVAAAAASVVAILGVAAAEAEAVAVSATAAVDTAETSLAVPGLVRHVHSCDASLHFSLRGPHRSFCLLPGSCHCPIELQQELVDRQCSFRSLVGKSSRWSLWPPDHSTQKSPFLQKISHQQGIEETVKRGRGGKFLVAICLRHMCAVLKEYRLPSRNIARSSHFSLLVRPPNPFCLIGCCVIRLCSQSG